ncbi:MAG: isoprenylcysteine carboxylmethyltransferase family protein [Balneolales bacterium]
MNSKFQEERLDAAHKRSWQTFEIIFGIPFLAAIVLQFIVPPSLPYGLFAPAIIVGGVAFIITGTVIIFLARREFSQYGQPTDPGHPTNKLVTTGVFSISRNPLYLGGVCIVTGIALSFNLPWVLAFLLVALVACHYILIVPEEQYLSQKFGTEYQAYAASVYRWIGHTRHDGSE